MCQAIARYKICHDLAITFGAIVIKDVLRPAISNLLEKTPILRIDLGASMKDVAGQVIGIRTADHAAETALVNAQTVPAQWRTTDHGFIVRLFVSSIGSGLDIDWSAVSQARSLAM